MKIRNVSSLSRLSLLSPSPIEAVATTQRLDGNRQKPALKAATNRALLLTGALLFPITAQSASAQNLPVPMAPGQAVPTEAAPGQIRKGWPISLPGTISGSVAAAQLNGEGPLEIVVAASGRRAPQPAPPNLVAPPAADPNLNRDALIYALNSQGEISGGFPVKVVSAAAMDADKMGSVWFGSPGIADLDGDGSDEIVHIHPGLDIRGISVFYGDGGPWPFTFVDQTPDCWISLPIADLDGDGVLDFVAGNTLTNALGKDLKDWPANRRFDGGYQSVIGDADGDGMPEVFHGFYQNDWNAPGQPPRNTIEGFDRTGKSLPKWQKKIDGIVIYAAMGDICGDEKAEIVAIDSGGNGRAWHADGTPVAGSTSEELPGGIVRDGLLFKGGSGYGPISLADLDGDGKAEILFVGRRGLQAFKGDGTAWKDGMLSRVTGLGSSSGVSVVDLGGDGVADLFVGSKWIRALPDGPQVMELLPGVAGADFASAPSIVDLEGDGKAEVLLGARDGRVWIYDTGQTLDAKGLQWHTTGGSFRHTSAWFNPKTRTAEQEKWSQARWKP